MPTTLTHIRRIWHRLGLAAARQMTEQPAWTIPRKPTKGSKTFACRLSAFERAKPVRRSDGRKRFRMPMATQRALLRREVMRRGIDPETPDIESYLDPTATWRQNRQDFWRDHEHLLSAVNDDRWKRWEWEEQGRRANGWTDPYAATES